MLKNKYDLYKYKFKKRHKIYIYYYYRAIYKKNIINYIIRLFFK